MFKTKTKAFSLNDMEKMKYTSLWLLLFLLLSVISYNFIQNWQNAGSSVIQTNSVIEKPDFGQKKAE
jgi:hypothetical protein